jgi:alpha-L-fucosidase
MAGIYDPIIGGYDLEQYWGDLSDPSTQNKIATVTTAQNQAVAKGNNWLVKGLDLVLKYADPILAVFSKYGVIKNKNLNSLGTESNWDLEKLQAILEKTKNPSIDDIETAAKESSNTTDNRNSANEIFGIPVSYLLVGLAILVGIMIYKSDDQKTKNKS